MAAQNSQAEAHFSSKNLRISKDGYRNVFLVQNREYWNSCPYEFDKDKDIVFSFDFGVVNLIKDAGGEAQYIDHVLSSELMEQYNYKTYEFFAAWHYNADNQDIFSYREIEVGSAFKIEIWNDITYYVRLFANLQALSLSIRYTKIYAGIKDPVIKSIIQFLNIQTKEWSVVPGKTISEYYFPIFMYMDNALHPENVKRKIKILGIKFYTCFTTIYNKLLKTNKAPRYVYIENYYPTAGIIKNLYKDRGIKMVRNDFTSLKDMFTGLHLPIFVPPSKHHCNNEKFYIENFQKQKHAKITIGNIDISNELYKIIIKRIIKIIAKAYTTVDIILDFFSKRKLSLMITMSNIGIVNRLLINYCQKNNIDVFTVINGILANSFLDEAKVGTWINSYGESVKANYFRGMNNVVCLGDPRMDTYATFSEKKTINYKNPVIAIGASGFANLDLNCYLAIEFEFINDIMKACKKLRDQKKDMKLLIKVRSNGYVQQYKSFIDEYFPEFRIAIYDSTTPIMEIYKQCDFFISIYSQTLFEASCLGIPVLYYKNDTQYFHPPFDGKSELVTACNLDDLIAKIEGFYQQDPIYECFKQKDVMEKYIGPLDGENLSRSMDFIYSLIPEKKS